MQEVAPAPPAQIITSEMLLPQYLLHCSLDSRGRAACCSILGVLGAVGDRKDSNTQDFLCTFESKSLPAAQMLTAELEKRRLE